jgi:hypothetical protein
MPTFSPDEYRVMNLFRVGDNFRSICKYAAFLNSTREILDRLMRLRIVKSIGSRLGDYRLTKKGEDIVKAAEFLSCFEEKSGPSPMNANMDWAFPFKLGNEVYYTK